jgi:hypothetical protein
VVAHVIGIGAFGLTKKRSQKERSVTQKVWWLATAAAALMSVALVACNDSGGDDEASADVQAAIEATVDAWNANDVEGVLAHFTDAGVQSSFGATREEAAAALPEVMGATIVPGELEITVDGDSATAEAEQWAIGATLDPRRMTLVNEGDEWLIDAEEKFSAEIPSGTTAVELKALEYQFDFDASAVTSGDFAFDVENTGGEEHIVDLFSVPVDLDIEQALRSEEEVAGVESIGATPPIEPGGTTTMVFTEPLAAGRYAILCFVEAEDGEPHALKGMVADFQVG